MEIMELFTQLKGAESVFLILFVWMLFEVKKEYKEMKVQSLQREEKLMTFCYEMKDEFAKLGAGYNTIVHTQEKLAFDIEEIKKTIQTSKGKNDND